MNMATSMDLKTNIVGVYSAPPKNITETRFSYKISFSNDQSLNNNHNGIMQNWVHIILCYQNHGNKEDSGWHVGGWIKASLGNALSEHPILAGRLRRSDDGGDFEIVSNDSGVRCVEAEVPMNLVEFLESKDEKNEVEGNLVYWEDVDESNPQFSPLLSIQVTNFKCGGYSVGISCHILLADTLFMANFLKKWSEYHRSIAYEGEIHKIPLLNTYSLKQIGCSLHATNTNNRPISKTILFNIFTYEKFNSGDEICKYFVQLCLEKVESKFGNKFSSPFTLLTRESNGDVKVVISTKQALFVSNNTIEYEFNSMEMEDLKANEIAFLKGNGPVDASHWISCEASFVMVVVVISPPGENKFGVKVYVTVPWV